MSGHSLDRCGTWAIYMLWGAFHGDVTSGAPAFLPYNTPLRLPMLFKKQTYSTQAAEYIRGLIRTGQLSPGDPVREAAITEKLHISRAPVREALLLLGQQGLIESEPQKGKYVRTMSPREIYESYVVAGILEGAGVAQSIHLWGKRENEAFANALHNLEEQSSHAIQQGTLASVDDLFHTTLLSTCNNARLIELARTNCTSLAKFLYYNEWKTLFTPHEFHDRHHIIAEAVATRDPWHIENTLRQHYEEVGMRLSEQVKRQLENNQDS